MVDYAYEEGFNTLSVVASASAKDMSFSISDSLRLARLGPENLRALRDQITAHLGDAAKPEPLPVGTIVAGKGLTEIQKNNLPNLDYLRDISRKMGRNITGMSWHDTEEGYSFWEAVHHRLIDLRKSVIEEKNRREKAPEAVTIDGVMVSSYPGSNQTSATIEHTKQGVFVSSANARAVAAALIQHADAAEKSS